LSKALRDRRSRVFLASKCGLVWDDQGRVRNDLSENSLIQEVPQILKRLGTDRLDLLQVHWPSPEFSLEATFTALAKIKEKGWALHLGVCNFSLSDFQKAQNYTPLDSYQGLYNMLEHNPGSYHGIDLSYKVREEILPETTTRGQGFFPYSPLMQGLLGGNIGPEKVFEKK
jgi:aryl-alcohol dehydrogenase-like predicted oxidoreductase